MTKQKASKQDGNLSYIQKKAICKYRLHNKMSCASIAQWAKKEFNLLHEPSESTISRTLSKQETFLALVPQDHNIKRTRVVVHPQLEAALVTWVLQMQHQKLSIMREHIREKARRFATTLNIPTTIKFSDGWISLFCKRNAFSMHRSHGESGAANIDSPNVQETLAHIRALARDYVKRHVVVGPINQ